MAKNKILSNSILLVTFSLVASMLGMVRDSVFAYFYGMSAVTDAYSVANSAYLILFSVISGSIATAYIQKVATYDDDEKINKVTSLVILFSSSIVFAISIIICIFPNLYTLLFAYGMSEETMQITATMLRIIVPFCAFTTIRYIFGSYFKLSQIFWFDMIARFLSDIINMIVCVISNQNYIILSLGNAISVITYTALAFFIAHKKGFRFKIDKNCFTDVKAIILMAIPLCIGQLVQNFNTIVDKNFASSIGEGMITSINYAGRVKLIFVTLFVVSITTVLFPSLSKLSKSNKEEFNRLSIKTSKIVSMFAIPISFAIVLLSQEIIEILFLRGQFTLENATITAEILMIYALGIPALSLNEIINKQFYALGDTKTPVKSSVVSLLFNIVFNFILVSKFKHIGLAISTTISVYLLYFMLNYQFSKKYGVNILRKIKLKLLKTTISAIIMSVVVLILKNIIENNILLICFSGATGVIVYFICLYIFKDDELLEINFSKLKKR